jgi:hypothetical protein
MYWTLNKKLIFKPYTNANKKKMTGEVVMPDRHASQD